MSDTIEVYDRMALDYVTVAEDRPIGLDEFIGTLTPKSRVLDLGCGPGMHAAHIAAAGHDVLAVDGSAEMVALAAAHPGVTAQQATFDQIASFGPVDGVWASFSLLHAPRTEMPGHLAALHGLCSTGAPLWLGMKLGQQTEQHGNESRRRNAASFSR